jgi:hemoglobin
LTCVNPTRALLHNMYFRCSFRRGVGGSCLDTTPAAGAIATEPQRPSRNIDFKETSIMGLYEDLGGAAAVNAAVDIFYRKVLQDERIKSYFSGVDMAKQAAKQKAFLTMAFGGPNNYTGLDMRKGHAHLVARGLSDVHFDAVIEDLAATLRELKVSEGLISQVAAVAETTRNDVLGR